MKKIAGLVVILVVLILGSFYLMGYQSEAGVNAFVKGLNKAEGVSARIADYHRGWFTSDAVIETKVVVPERVVKSNGQMITVPAEEYSLEVPLKIKHGPVILSNQGMYFGLGYASTEIGLPDKLAQRFQQLFTDKSDKPVIRVSLYINYMKKVWFSVAVPKFTLYAKNDDGKLVWEGLDASMAVSDDVSSLTGKFDMDGFKLSKKDVLVDMKGFDFNYKFDLDKYGLMIGNAAMDFPGITVTQAGQSLLEVKNIDMKVEHDVKDDLFSSQLHASIDKVQVQGDTFGPGQLDMAIKNIDAEVLGRVNKKVNELQNASPEESRRIVMELLPELPALLSKGAIFEISTLSFVLPNGTIKGQLMVSLPSGEVTKNPFALIQKIQGDGQLTVPAQVLEATLTEKAKQAMKDPQTRQLMEQMRQARQQSTDQSSAATTAMDDKQMIADMVKAQLDQLTQAGIVVKKGNDYFMEFKLENGRLTVNGKPFNPAMLK